MKKFILFLGGVVSSRGFTQEDIVQIYQYGKKYSNFKKITINVSVKVVKLIFLRSLRRF